MAKPELALRWVAGLSCVVLACSTTSTNDDAGTSAGGTGSAASTGAAAGQSGSSAAGAAGAGGSSAGNGAGGSAGDSGSAGTGANAGSGGALTTGGAAGVGAAAGAGATAGAGAAGSGGSGGTGGGKPTCPTNMVPVDADTCIDRFELQHTIPLGSNPQAGVVPDENIKPLSMRLSCQGNNKRLCTLEELADACSNGGAQMYPYGNTFEATSCGSMSVHPTASLSECQSENGAFDLVGNVWETAAFTGSSGTTYIFGGDFRGSTAATGSCCIRTEAGDPYPAGCEQFFDDLDAFKGANISQVEVNALTHTQDILGNPISLGYRCCQDL